MKYVYILQSLAAEEHFYTGITDDLDARLAISRPNAADSDQGRLTRLSASEPKSHRTP